MAPIIHLIAQKLIDAQDVAAVDTIADAATDVGDMEDPDDVCDRLGPLVGALNTTANRGEPGGALEARDHRGLHRRMEQHAHGQWRVVRLLRGLSVHDGRRAAPARDDHGERGLDVASRRREFTPE